MEQRKSDINTGDGNVINVDTNGLSYSFDFSNQVQSNPQAQMVQNVQQPMPQQAPVVPQQVPVMQNVQQTPVAPQQAPVMQDVPQQAPVMQNVPQQANSNVQQTQYTSNNTEDDVLIKDKKSTKTFLIFLFVLVISFIIALPFVYKYISPFFG